jgi:hypothetical protein
MNNERYEQIIYEAYQNYVNQNDGVLGRDHLWTLKKEEFINKCKTDTEFSEKWGFKIEERELSLEERFNIKYPGGKFSIFQENYPNTHKRNNPNDLLDAFDIPTKLITITYNDKTIESYE